MNPRRFGRALSADYGTYTARKGLYDAAQACGPWATTSEASDVLDGVLDAAAARVDAEALDPHGKLAAQAELASLREARARLGSRTLLETIQRNARVRGTVSQWHGGPAPTRGAA
jgi:hypothetical protein